MPQNPAVSDKRDTIVDVAVAVLQRADGSVLLARRPKNKVYAGYWEFPGGKLEPGETPLEALHREIREELSVQITRAHPWITRIFTYPHATVRLLFFRVSAWEGELDAVEHEAVAWERPNSVKVAPMLPANGPVLRGLALPAEYAISQAGGLGIDAFLQKLRRRLNADLRLVQLREPGLPSDEFERLSRQVLKLARPSGAKVLINGDVGLAHRVGADGVHLTARQVSRLNDRPDLPLVGASCHGIEELRAAEQLGADFAVLGPIRPTPSHPGRNAMGWRGFEAIAQGSAIPIYALGGVMPEDLETAWSRGAHGVAMIRGAWKN